MSFQRQLRVVTEAPNAAADAMSGVKVAFASADRKHVDQHFGAAEGFVIYRVDAAGSELLEVAQFGRLDMDGNEDKLAAKIEALGDCVAVYCQAIGASAIGQLKPRGIQPIKVTPDTPIDGLLGGLRRELAEGPSPWLARAMERHAPQRADRFDLMEAEGWSE